jgi:hypothetical protein
LFSCEYPLLVFLFGDICPMLYVRCAGSYCGLAFFRDLSYNNLSGPVPGSLARTFK